MSNSSDSDLLSIFGVEVKEYLESLNEHLLQVEMATGDEKSTVLREMNRVAHSMKGAARAVGLNVIETIGHYMEEVFEVALNDGLDLTPDVADSLYDGLDLIQNIVDGEESNSETVAMILSHLEQIVAATATAPDLDDTTEIVNGGDTAVRVVDSQTPLAHPPPVAAGLDLQSPDSTSMPVFRQGEETIRVAVSKLDRIMAEASELLVTKMHGEERQRKVSQLRHLNVRWQREWRSVRAAYIRLVRRLQDQEDEVVSELAALFRFLESNQRYLTETNRLLNQLGQRVMQDNTNLNLLAEQLQDDVARLRMMPFETITGSFQRMMRDLARDLGKQINFEIEGLQVEIDKMVLDALKDPILHLLRNAADHGLEDPAEREAAGKPAAGNVLLVMEQRGGDIVVRVADDGKGIDPEKIRQSAVQRGLLSEQEAALLGENEIRGYIFHSGFTTTDKVTAVSGRGLGMDIVRDRVESLRGRVNVESEIGKGSTITLNVPVSLTRIRCILLRIGEESFAVPATVVDWMETFSRKNIFTAEGRDMVEVNNRPVPLVSLGAVLGVPMTTAPDSTDSRFVALEAANRIVAFEVDDLFSEQELVLKPLGPEMQAVPFVTGAALLGTGEVIIVLDANDLVRKATGVALPRRRTTYAHVPAAVDRRLCVLVVDDSITTRTLEKNILETAGFDVHVAIDGAEAWSMLAEVEFDVVISDVEMPNMNGLELTARIKGASQYQHLPVILLTSLGKPEQREAGLRAGADAYLIKSRFDQGELLETVYSVVV